MVVFIIFKNLIVISAYVAALKMPENLLLPRKPYMKWKILLSAMPLNKQIFNRG